MIDKEKRILILDFDGVVADTEPVHFMSWNQTFQEQFNLSITGDHTQLVGLSLEEIYKLWLQQAPYPLVLDAEQKRFLLARKTELFFESAVEHLQVMPGLIELVEKARAKGWYIAIASRALRKRLFGTLHLLQIPTSFDLIVGSEDCVDEQSDRKVHRRTADAFNISPHHAIVIEDSASGVADAIACGIGTVFGLTTSLNREQLLLAGAHYVIDSLHEVNLDI